MRCTTVVWTLVFLLVVQYRFIQVTHKPFDRVVYFRWEEEISLKSKHTWPGAHSLELFVPYRILVSSIFGTELYGPHDF